MRPENVTLEWLQARCFDDAGCLRWKGTTSRNGQPRYRFREGDLDSSLHLRRVAWKVAGKRELKPGEVLAMSCGCSDCLEVKHMEPVTRADILARNSTTAAAKRKKDAAVTEAIRAQRAKITMDDARYIRSSDKTLTALGLELGISFQLVSKIRRGEAWPDLSNPLAGLGAR